MASSSPMSVAHLDSRQVGCGLHSKASFPAQEVLWKGLVGEERGRGALIYTRSDCAQDEVSGNNSKSSKTANLYSHTADIDQVKIQLNHDAMTEFPIRFTFGLETYQRQGGGEGGGVFGFNRFQSQIVFFVHYDTPLSFNCG